MRGSRVPSKLRLGPFRIRIGLLIGSSVFRNSRVVLTSSAKHAAVRCLLSPSLVDIVRRNGALAARRNAPLIERYRLDQCEHRIAGLEGKLVDGHAGRHGDQMSVAVEI